MPSGAVVAIISADPKFIDVCKTELGSSSKIVTYLQRSNSERNGREALQRAIEKILGLENGDISTKAVITDSVFRRRGQPSYFIGDVLFSGHPGRAGSLLSMLLGAGIPVIVNPNTKDVSKIWQIGASGAQYYGKGKLSRVLKRQINEPKYNLHTLEVENDFASNYDAEELAGAATVSAIIWENDYVRKYVEKHIRAASSSVRILDLGTGTGRFVEILLSDKTIKSKIDSIVAIDFAPMYLIKAKERLMKTCKPALAKTRFLRRIAEDLRWPDNYFDIVIAGFGITCFSRFHLTLPEMHRVLKPGGLALMNGYNRAAITFDFETLMKGRVGQPASHFAIRIDRDENQMHLGDQIIQCFTFNVDDLEVLLKLIGFKPIKDSVQTFPALYGSARKEYLKKLPGRVPHTGRRRKTVASYQRANLIADHFNSGFNEVLHMIDDDLAAVLKDKGFYFCMAMHK